MYTRICIIKRFLTFAPFMFPLSVSFIAYSLFGYQFTPFYYRWILGAKLPSLFKLGFHLWNLGIILKLALSVDFFQKSISQITTLSTAFEPIRLDEGYSDHLRRQLAWHRLLQTSQDSLQQKDACPYLDMFQSHKYFRSKLHNGEVLHPHSFLLPWDLCNLYEPSKLGGFIHYLLYNNDEGLFALLCQPLWRQDFSIKSKTDNLAIPLMHKTWEVSCFHLLV